MPQCIERQYVNIANYNYVVNDVSHILYECDCIKDVRNRYWHEVQMNTPEILFLEIDSMMIKGKTKIYFECM